MSVETATLPTGTVAASRGGALDAVKAHWPLAIGFAAMLIPTLVRLSQQVWPLEIGAHGPIVLATGIWLLFHVREELLQQASKPPMALVAIGLVLSVGLYVFGRPYDLLALEVAGVYGFFLSCALLFLGLRPMLRNIFPFAYLGFMVPPPTWLVDMLTAPLQMFVSTVATGILQGLDYPIAREGIVIYIAQYQLLVEEACSGMNSLLGLIAVMSFYIYIIHRASFRYTLVLGAAILPIAVLVNIVRVMALILLTYYAGDEVAQGFLHVTTGVILFSVALLLTILVDKGLQMVLAKRQGSRGAGNAVQA